MKRKTLYERFGDRLLEEEDKAGPQSYKRMYIASLYKNYAYKNLFWYFIAFMAIGMIIYILSYRISDMTNTETKILMTTIVLLIGIASFVLTKRLKNEKKEEMDTYARKKFDADYGKGSYDRTMEQIKKR